MQSFPGTFVLLEYQVGNRNRDQESGNKTGFEIEPGIKSQESRQAISLISDGRILRFDCF